MNDLITLMAKNFLTEVKPTIDAAFNAKSLLIENKDFSRLIFRGTLNKNNTEVINAHIQAIYIQLEKITAANDNFRLKEKAVFIEYSKSITLFDRITNSLKLTPEIYGDNIIVSQNFYLNAVRAYKMYVPCLYQGDMDFACIPLQLRLAIEIYFKNMIGYTYSEQEYLLGSQKGKISPYPLSISDLLKFFKHKDHRKYIALPIDLEILSDINYWCNNLIHTGIISFAWQNLTAIELLHPLFYTKHKDGHIHVEGFNYLSPYCDLKNLEADLNNFLSNKLKKSTLNY